MAAGNHGTVFGHSLDETIPQRLATAASPLIVVGGVHNNGRLWTGTTPGGQLGKITTYAQAAKVASQNYQGRYDVLTEPAVGDVSSGTSYASPAVVSDTTSGGERVSDMKQAGMIAYWLNIPSLRNAFFRGNPSFAHSVKNFVARYSWQRRATGDFSEPGDLPYAWPIPTPLPVAYNGIHRFVLLDTTSYSSRLTLDL